MAVYYENQATMHLDIIKKSYDTHSCGMHLIFLPFLLMMLMLATDPMTTTPTEGFLKTTLKFSRLSVILSFLVAIWTVR